MLTAIQQRLSPWLLALTLVGSVSASFSSLAQTTQSSPSGSAPTGNWPTRQVRIIVPYPGATGPDLVARGLASGMSKVLGQNVLVENKQGGGGVPSPTTCETPFRFCISGTSGLCTSRMTRAPWRLATQEEFAAAYR